LIVIKGADEGKQFELTENLVGVGRDKANVVHLHDTEVSRRHLELRSLGAGRYRIVDLGSINGTMVNTQMIRERELQPGDHIQIGQTILVYSGSRQEHTVVTSDLADRIRMVARQGDFELSSAIVKRVNENEGSQILARPDKVQTQWLRTRLANLGVMYETIQAVSHIMDVDQLLTRIMELVFTSIEADHGCIMLKNSDSGDFEPKSVRYRIDQPDAEKMVISRTIMDYVLQEKQGILVSDASKDDRFNIGQSIAKFHLREVICVPMKGRHETLGVLFLDTQSSVKSMVASGSETGKFTEEHLALAIAIAHQAALAVEETRYHQAMVNAERLAAIGQTVAALSHHIKNIMQGVRFGSDMVNRGVLDRDDTILLKGWKLVEKNQAKIHDLVLDMLNFSKDREPNIEMVNLNKIVEEVLDVVRGRAADKRIELVWKPSPILPPIPADPEGVHRSLLNIVSNAMDAVEERESPRVAVQTILEADGEWVRMIVLDNGPGVPVEKRDDIFKPFVSTKGARGTGLGLPVSRKVFREHGGDILLESQVGKGSKFILRLPLKSAWLQEGNGTMPFLPFAEPVEE